MRPVLVFAFTALSLAATDRPHDASGNLVLVEGGAFRHPKSNFYGKGVTVSDFHIGKYEVTQQEWEEVMGTNPSQFRGENRPVEMVTWYQAIDYCNRRSLREGRAPYYTIHQDRPDPANDNPHDDVRWTVTINPEADGYRLPTEAEWEYAATGGQLSRGRTYSGSDELERVGWYWQNAGDRPLAGAWNWPMIEKNNGRPQPVGRKAPNELGLHDMSGNVREWCWDWYQDTVGAGPNPQGSERGAQRVWKGGGWVGGDFCCAPSFRASYEPHSRGYDQGFRVCRSATRGRSSEE